MDCTVRSNLCWETLPRAAQAYVGFVIIGGALVLLQTFPFSYPKPFLFLMVLAAVCLTAGWKVTLPIPLVSGSTLSVSYAAKLMALLLFGMPHAILVGVIGALTQCTYKARQTYPVYRTAFSMAAEAIAIMATGIVYASFGGTTGSLDIGLLAKPLVAAITAYFLVNTSLVAAAIGLSTHRRVVTVWREDFVWSGVTEMVAGSAGALAAVIIDRGHTWIAVLMLAPVYLTYRTYQLFVARLEEQQEHMAEMRRLLAEMTRLEETRNELLAREQVARASAEQANTLKDQFLAVVSHELRTPLNAILGWADMLRTGKIDNGRQLRAFQCIYDGANRQARLIDDLLDVARIMSGKLRLDPTRVDMEDVLDGALNMLQPAADAKGVDIRVDVGSPIDPIFGDRARLQQIVWNLLSNAIKFTPQGGGVDVRLRPAYDGVEMSVSDSGQGIPRDFIASVFEPFRQADGSTTRPQGGLGLGLAIVKHLVEAHGGSISVQSRGEGQGATFTVRLPFAGTVAAIESAVMIDRVAPLPTQPEPSLPSIAGVEVLVVDDDDQGKQVVAAQLEAHGATVTTASSAAEAFQFMQREHFDVLLADIAMPNEDGYALIQKIRALYPSPLSLIPAAALTAFARNEDKLQAIHSGFQLHLVKPIDGRALVTAVARLGRRFPERRQAPNLVVQGTASIQ